MTSTAAMQVSTGDDSGMQGTPLQVDEDDEASIDEEQLDEYRDMIEKLGHTAEKVAVNSLSMVAEDHADSKSSAKAIYDIIRQRLVTTSKDNLLPLVYVLDSILKNVKGFYIEVVQEDAASWFPEVYGMLPQQQRAKLQKVWRTWGEFKVFSPESLQEMGKCFDEKNTDGTSAGSDLTATYHSSNAQSSKLASQTPSSLVNGISRAKDGSLQLQPSLRREMQNILDDMQSAETDELKKVSLERLADINPELLSTIKDTAQSLLQEDDGNANRNTSHHTSSNSNSNRHNNALSNNGTLPFYFTETRSPETLERANEWKALLTKKTWDPQTQTHGIISKLQQQVRHQGNPPAPLSSDGDAGASGSTTTLYTATEAMDQTHYLAAAAATAAILTSALERLQNPPTSGDGGRPFSSSSGNHPNALSSFPGEFVLGSFSQSAGGGIGVNNGARGAGSGGGGSNRTAGMVVDRSKFTNDGIKEKNDQVIALLYQVGLPFVSSADGRRFATQVELSHHLDSLFKRHQLEKSIARTEERGWYLVDLVWTGEVKEEDMSASAQAVALQDGGGGGAQSFAGGIGSQGAMDSTVIADETRDTCAICGINFKMFFDNEDGVYKYSNCREIEVLNDDAAERESDQVLVHGSCWSGLGSPEVLTGDQTMQETDRY